MNTLAEKFRNFQKTKDEIQSLEETLRPQMTAILSNPFLRPLDGAERFFQHGASEEMEQKFDLNPPKMLGPAWRERFKDIFVEQDSFLLTASYLDSDWDEREIRFRLPLRYLEMTVAEIEAEIQPPLTEKIYYKMVMESNRELFSLTAFFNLFAVHYEPGIWMKAPEGGLFVFETKEAAELCYSGAEYPRSSLWECLCAEPLPLPNALPSLGLVTDKDIQTFWLRGSLPPKALPMCVPPEGTRLFKQVKLLRRV